MSEEEIRALAAELGLDAIKLTLFEPWRWESDGRRYQFEYKSNGQVLDFNFVVSNDDILAGHESVAVKVFVNKGLRELVRSQGKWRD